MDKDGIDALKAEIPAIKATLTSKVNAADYFDAEWVQVQALLQEIGDELDACSSRKMVENLLIEFDQKVLLIRTKAVYSLIDEYKGFLSEFASNANRENYSAENYQKISEICDVTKATLDTALTIEEAENIYYEAYLELVSLPNMAVENYKEAQISQLKTLYAEANYESDTWQKVKGYLDTYESSIRACTDMENIDTCVTLAKKQLDEFMTIAEIAALTNRKNSAIVELNSYCDQKYYTAENWNIILGIIQSASDEINAYGTISQIDEKVATVKVALDAIEKVKDTSSSNDKNRGCSSALDIGGIGVIVALLGMAITILIVKNKKQRF